MVTNNSINAHTTNTTVVAGNGTGYTNITYSSTPSTSTIMSRDSNGNSVSNNLITSATAVTSASSTTVMTASSTRTQVLQGSQNQNFQLPNATTLSIGWTFEFNNNSTGILTVLNTSSTTICTIPAGGYARVFTISVSTSAGAWDSHFLIPNNGSYGTAGLSVTGYNQASTTQITGYATTATAAATTTLTATSAQQQYFTGTTTQTVVLPVTSTLVLGQSYTIVNNSTGVVTVQSSGANTIQAMAANSQLIVTCILTSGTTAASWNAEYTNSSPVDLHTANFIVGSGSSANYTTIASAITAANSAGSPQTIFIQPGTYTENLTLQPGINLTAWGCDSSINDSPNVIIIGKLSFSSAGTVSIFGIELQTNSDNFLAVTGSSASIVNLNNCYLNASNNTGISFTSSSASSVINLYYCQGNIGTTGIAFFASSASGSIQLRYTTINNTGASTTQSTISAGNITFRYSEILFPITSSGTGAIFSSFNRFNTGAINTTSLTCGGSGAHTIFYGVILGGTASALSVSNTTQLIMANIGSSNTNAITGAGVLQFSGLQFTSSSTNLNVSTLIGGTIWGAVGYTVATGYLGEQIRSFIPAASQITLTNNTAANITSISLTSGTWDISAIGILAGTLTGTEFALSINDTSATLSANNGDQTARTPTVSTVASTSTLTIPSFRVTLAATTTYYLVSFALFTVGTATSYGRISATRVG